jgi:hypothetical protein
MISATVLIVSMLLYRIRHELTRYQFIRVLISCAEVSNPLALCRTPVEKPMTESSHRVPSTPILCAVVDVQDFGSFGLHCVT